jgi:hypothetical protein
MVPRMVLRGIVAVLIVLAIVWQATPAHADAAEVEALIAKGNELRRAGKPGPALPYFQKAYELAHTPRTTGQLGLAELAAGYPVEAADHLATALESPNDPSIGKYRQMLADALTMARGQIGELAVQGSPAGAEVLVDGRSVGALPLPSTIKVPAHNTEVIVRAPGYAERRQFVPIAGGHRHEVAIDLPRIEQAPELPPVVMVSPSPAPSPSPPRPTSASAVAEEHAADATTGGDGSGLRTAAWVVGGGAVVAAGTGLALHLSAESNLSDFNGSCKNDPTDGIVMRIGGVLTKEQCHDHLDSWTWQRRWSVIGYVSGAALAVASTVLFLTSRPATPTAHAHLQCGPTANGVSCLGTF